MKRTLLPAIAILLAGCALGLGFNAVRPTDSIKLSRNYFAVYQGPVGAPATAGNPAAGSAAPAGAAEPDNPEQAASSGAQVVDDAPAGAPDNAEAPNEPKHDHPFTVASIDKVIELYQSDAAILDLVVFVDARRHDHFDEAHIPGAVNIDRYNSDIGWQQHANLLMQAEQIVVYCGGGECEDSIFLASELVHERFVPADKILLFEGGMDEWTAENLPIEQGHGGRVSEGL